MKAVVKSPHVPGQQDKRLTGNGEKLAYSPAAGCNWLCLAGVSFSSLSREAFCLRTRYMNKIDVANDVGGPIYRKGANWEGETLAVSPSPALKAKTTINSPSPTHLTFPPLPVL